MIPRRRLKTVEHLLDRSPAVVMLGPRQSGKTTLARTITEKRGAAYFDLESDRDRAKLTDIEDTLGRLSDKLVVLDEVHRVPELFQPLRGLIDEGRRKGKRTGRYLLLGSASLDLLRQSGESLAGRLAIIELGPFDLLEVGAKRVDELWLRGGFPDSFLAVDEDKSLRWRRDFIRTYLERDVKSSDGTNASLSKNTVCPRFRSTAAISPATPRSSVVYDMKIFMRDGAL